MKVAWLPTALREGLRCQFFARQTILNPRLRRRGLNASAKQFSTSIRLRAGIAAPEIKFKNQGKGEGEEEKIFFARLIPESPSYFTAQPAFTDDLLALQDLVRKYSTLPVVKPGEAPRVAWRSLVEYRNMVGESVKASKYHKIVEVLRRLNQIQPSLMPSDVAAALNEYKRDISPFQNVSKIAPLDEFGRAAGHGRRKTSSATAWVVEGTGEVLVNGKTLAEAFGRIHDRESAIWALKATDRIDKYNVWARVGGGGTTGQAEAMTLAVGKALLSHEPALKPALRRGTCLYSTCPIMQTEFLAHGMYSRVYDARSQEGREEKAWTPQGKKDACMGEAIDDVVLYCISRNTMSMGHQNIRKTSKPVTKNLERSSYIYCY
jgi:small subunit ribosomal protein S9